MEFFVTCMRSSPTIVSKPLKFCAKIMEICSSWPWNVEKKSNQPGYLNFYAIWRKYSSNSIAYGSNLVIFQLFFGAMTLIKLCGRFLRMSRFRSPSFEDWRSLGTICLPAEHVSSNRHTKNRYIMNSYMGNNNRELWFDFKVASTTRSFELVVIIEKHDLI